VILAGLLVLPAVGASGATSCDPVTQDGPCGMNLEAAWATYTTGDPSVLVAYIEGGINWRDSDAAQLVTNIYVNWHEIPVPCFDQPCQTVYSQNRSDYDTNADGLVNAADWAGDPRTTDGNGNGILDPEDLIAAFSDGIDHDGNGYTNDISGWDFYDHQNDPATYDSVYQHANDQMERIQHVCPLCTIMPVKAGAEALDRSDDLAQAWLYAGDAGASVIASTTADLGYSSFMAQAVDSLANRGVLMVQASNDFDSTDHQGGMFHPNVIPANGAVPTADGKAWVRSNYTSWGTHNMFTVATNGGTTSEATPTMAGVFGLLLSWGLQAAERGLIDGPLTAGEAVQVMRTTARPFHDGSLPWPGGPGAWNLQYGYGMPNLLAAMDLVAADRVAPGARIDSPDWYALFDPTRQSRVEVDGTIRAPRTAGFTWVLQAATAAQPHAKQWFRIGTGSGAGTYRGSLGTLDLSRIPESFWSKPFAISKTKALETTEEYAVSLRLTATDAEGRVALDRRAVNVVHDPTWLAGFPLRLRSGGESQPALVDLQATGHPAIVFGGADGLVHAVDPVTRHELPGWPVHTRPVQVLVEHAGVHPGFEPVLADVAVGDLEGTGELSVVAATTTGRVYVFDPRGAPRPGWPRTLDTGVERPGIPRPDLPYTRLPVQGLAAGGPVLFDMDGDGTLEVIAGGWDGYLHVWRPDGSDLPGWPVKVGPPAEPPPPGYVLVDDQKLETPPAVAFLQGRAAGPFLVMRSQYTETHGSGLQPNPFGLVFAYGADGSPATGWPDRIPGVVEYYGSAQEFVTEGTSAPSPST